MAADTSIQLSSIFPNLNKNKDQQKNLVTEKEARASGRILTRSKTQKMVSLGIEPRTFPEHLLEAIVNGKS